MWLINDERVPEELKRYMLDNSSFDSYNTTHQQREPRSMTIQIFRLSHPSQPLMEPRPVNATFFTFKGGEESVRLEETVHGADIVVVAKITSSSELMRLVLLADALSEASTKKLVLPYMPYARQDRRCNSGEAHSLKVVANLINSMGWDEVVIADPHSDVVEAVVNRCRIIRQHDIIAAFQPLYEFVNDPRTILVSPDAGALKKIYALAAEFEKTELVKADKKRELSTGKIIGIDLHTGQLPSDANYLIVDDICDGGGTFFLLAKALRERGAENVSLYVTHGIMSNGLGVFNGLIDEIWTTNSWWDRMIENHGEVHVNLLNLTNEILKGEL